MPVGATGAWCAQSAAGCQVLTYAQKPAWPVQSVWLDSVPPGYTFGIAQFNATYSNSPFGCPANCAGCAPTPVFPGQGAGSGGSGGGGQGGTPYEPPYQEPAVPPPPAPPPQLPYVPSQEAPVDVPPPQLQFAPLLGQSPSVPPGASRSGWPRHQRSGIEITQPHRLSIHRYDTLATVTVPHIGPILGNGFVSDDDERSKGKIKFIGPVVTVFSWIPFLSDDWKPRDLGQPISVPGIPAKFKDKDKWDKAIKDNETQLETLIKTELDKQSVMFKPGEWLDRARWMQIAELLFESGNCRTPPDKLSLPLAGC